MSASEYRPSNQVLDSLHGKTLVMIVGPTSIGKSSLMNHVVSLDSEFKRVSGFTTREARLNDEPGLYRYLSEAEVLQLIETHQAVQYVTHPTTGKIYGSEAQDYSGKYNVQDTLTTAVDNYHHLPFAKTITVSLSAEPETWLEWLKIRFPEPNEERTKRLVEAKQSIVWSLGQTANHHWLINKPDHLDTTAKELIERTKNGAGESKAPPQATEMLKLVDDLLSYK